MLAQAQEKGIACPVQTHVERLPFPDGHFDRVLAVDAWTISPTNGWPWLSRCASSSPVAGW